MAFIFVQMLLLFAKCFRKMEIDEKPFDFNHFHSQFIKHVITFTRCQTEMYKNGSTFAVCHTKMSEIECGKHAVKLQRKIPFGI